MNNRIYKVFISSTFKDLVEYRKAVVNALNWLSNNHSVTMEFFVPSEDTPEVLSLRELESCDIYLAIIGHRYGTLTKSGKSITHLEYEHAVKLNKKTKMPIFIYLASDKAALLPPSLIEPDETRVKHQKFREVLEKAHTPHVFESIDNLEKVVLATFRQELRSLNQNINKQITIFGEGEADQAFEVADAILGNRRDAIDDVLNSIATKFEDAFRIEHKSLAIHPVFRDLDKKLDSIIPGVIVDEASGVLKRANIQHVILRTDTIIRILEYLTVKELSEVGQKIGFEAAADLVRETLIKNNFVPDCPRAFVELWDYWDSTGGWGKIELESEETIGDESKKSDTYLKHIWKIRINNNFLKVNGDIDKTHKLCNFWSGYIHGFLDCSLPKISEMMQDLPKSDYGKINLPAYHRVMSIEHLPDNDIDNDTFEVTFFPLLLSDVYLDLNLVKKMISRGEFELSFMYASKAIKKARDIIDDSKMEEVINLIIPEEKREIIDLLFKPIEQFPPKIASDLAIKSKELVSKIVNELSNLTREDL